MKASIKTVTFVYNGTASSLDGLQVNNIEDKVYKDKASMPLWGVEDTGKRFQNSDVDLIWGLVSPFYEGKQNVTTYRKPELYLPGFLGLSSGSSFQDNLAGAQFARRLLGTTYCVGSSVGSSCNTNTYQTKGNLAMFLRASELTGSADEISRIPNLIFADLAASALVGTKGLSNSDAQSSKFSPVMVTPNISVIRYKLPFAIPAIIMAVILFAILVAVIVTAIAGKGGKAALRMHIQRLAPGRIYTTLASPAGQGASLRMPAKSWSTRFGTTQIDLSDDYEPIPMTDYVPEKVEPGSTEVLANFEHHTHIQKM